ncbi:acyl carrier protein [candidate division WOR-3 bacterium]|uniref:Acyl carrier protein n=1 Tax=candidate division WOR-3 bacterium TaxID=2052148 RepID=A0A660SHS3_UNCW3|nr:MAG: acyl carrier protein [candidate division WOR-3 bacterium]
MADLFDEVKKIIIDQLHVPPEKITKEARFIEDLGADSLDTVELVMAFEEKFHIQIPEEDAQKLETVGKALEYLETKLKETG